MPKHISTTALSKKLGVTSRELFVEFEKLEWITSDRNLTVDGFSIGGIYKEITKEGETIKYIAWPEDIELGVKPTDNQLLTATQLGKIFEVSALKINYIFAEIGWAKKGDLNKGWVTTPQGLAIGGVQSENTKTGIPYLRWPEAIINNKALLTTLANFRGHVDGKVIDPTIINFRERFAAKHQAIDGHKLRSDAEVLIDNWLYLFEIAHAYERKLPIEEELYSNFYIPHGKVYIEYFGCETKESYGYDKNCQKRKQEKLEIYQKYNFNHIVLEDKDIEHLDEVLPKMLLKFGVLTY